MNQTHTIVIGAGPAGLAVAACLKRLGLQFSLLEQSAQVATSWRGHYDRLQLHTTRDHSALPFTRMPPSYPTYPSRDQVIAYLETYAQSHGLKPEFGVRVKALRREGSGWHLRTNAGPRDASHVVVATGYNRKPVIPRWPGFDQFGGRILHSTDYREGAPFKGQRVLVVGLGNTGGELALDLWEAGAWPSISVRGPVRIMPRDSMGVPAQVLALRSQRLPLRARDTIGRWTSRVAFGDLAPLGLAEPEIGPASQVELFEKIPLLDVGTIDLIKQGLVEVLPGITAFSDSRVCFTDGRQLPFDVVLLATGFRPALSDILAEPELVLNARGYPRVSAGRSPRAGLYFVGFANPITGFVRQIGLDAQAVAADVAGVAP